MMFSNALERVARLCSILGGLVMTALMMMTCYSLISRNVFDTALIGDFELTGVGAGAAIALFMPLCQLKHENIIVDFFTANRSAAFNFRLDRLGDLLMTVIFALLAWRCTAAAINAVDTMGASMLLGFPDWIVFTSMAIPFAITALIAASQALSKFDNNKAAA
ncbi:MAG: TRAP transporter small permease [Limnohabitans sp.]|jgi:TRAP-type C4-dicarboxylate transport system permease small subunit|nr:TRAP transporter small permease [Limnohabitans sp.]MBP6244074.1 TRAP transporter small permease [Limnohabitans sp.]